MTSIFWGIAIASKIEDKISYVLYKFTSKSNSVPVKKDSYFERQTEKLKYSRLISFRFLSKNSEHITYD